MVLLTLLVFAMNKSILFFLDAEINMPVGVERYRVISWTFCLAGRTTQISEDLRQNMADTKYFPNFPLNVECFSPGQELFL